MRRRSLGAERCGPARYSFAAAKNTHLSRWLLHPVNWSGRGLQMGRGGQVAQVHVETIRAGCKPQRQTALKVD